MASVFHERDWVLEMADTPGWGALSAWVLEQARIESEAIERGVGSWDEYQRSVGALSAFRRVLDRPAQVVVAAEREASGDDNE